MKKPTEKQMSKLAEQTKLQFDGGDDNRLFFDDEMITVFAHLMTAKEYKAMEKDINSFNIKGDGYEIGCWNDCSGYKYWKSQGEASDSNYIQITAYISNASNVDAKSLSSDMLKAFHQMRKYHNVDEYLNTKE